jgi:hypothetical protein
MSKRKLYANINAHTTAKEYTIQSFTPQYFHKKTPTYLQKLSGVFYFMSKLEQTCFF